MSLMGRPAFLWKAKSRPPRAFAWPRLSRLAKPPSAAACRGALPKKAMWRLSMGKNRSLSAGLPGLRTPLATTLIKPSDALARGLWAAWTHYCEGAAGDNVLAFKRPA